MPTYSTIRNAAAPITGGMICPLIEDAASIAPAFTPERPARFISGIVKMPPETTFDTEEPDTTPFSADDTTATLAGAAAQMPEQRDRDLHHPIAAAGFVEQRAKQHEQKDEAGGDAERDAEHALGDQPLVRRKRESEAPLCCTASGI